MLRPNSVLLALGFSLGASLGASGCSDAPAPASSPEIPWPHSVEGFDGALVEALEAARDAVRAAPDDATAWMRLGMTYEAHLMLEYAGACYERAVEADDADPKYWYRLAVMRGRDGDVDRALEAYERVHALAPGYAPAHRRRGRFLVGVGRPEEAWRAFEAALALDPDDIGSELGLAEVELERGEPRTALARLDGLGAVPASNRGLYHRLRGTALARLERFEEAEPELERGRGARGGGADPWMREVGDLKVGESAVLLRTDRLIDGGQPEAALDLLRGLEERDPDDERIFMRKGRALARLGRWPEAAEALGRASELDAADLGLALAAASAMIETGDASGALAATDRVLVIEPAHAAAHLLRADLLLAAGRPDDAAAAIAAARAAGVETPALFVALGKTELERQRFEAARAAFAQALELDASDADAWAGAAIVRLQLGDAASAREAFERLCTLAPEHPLRASLEAALGQREGDR